MSVKIRRRAPRSTPRLAPAPKPRKEYSNAFATLLREFLASDPSEEELAIMLGQLAHLYGFVGGVSIVNDLDIDALEEITQEAYHGGMMSALEAFADDPVALAAAKARRAS